MVDMEKSKSIKNKISESESWLSHILCEILDHRYNHNLIYCENNGDQNGKWFRVKSNSEYTSDEWVYFAPSKQDGNNDLSELEIKFNVRKCWFYNHLVSNPISLSFSRSRYPRDGIFGNGSMRLYVHTIDDSSIRFYGTGPMIWKRRLKY